jgi:hypothetical protein
MTIDVYYYGRLSQDTDNIETVTFGSKVAEGQWTPYTLYRVTRSSIQNSMFVALAFNQKSIIKFRMYASDLAQAEAPPPKYGDKITDSDGIVYLIKNQPTLALGQVYNAECQAQIT